MVVLNYRTITYNYVNHFGEIVKVLNAY